ncbi:hypothetical protein PCASD_04193 [Puccinia coronata f. sp. avenae]|uniref:Uncharacterized protein n=1 Tax=Puccinia coronata f. sp. avenae TaxID=200324 RepID=A0A2N5SW37_9BASI|nr:hypothetical protein PCASD_16367 [Puccinia coronata f. sp. avenae]PLW46169.1 hypothetical protein PCASD_04193 [Puccinia coronata f. sp. avenae]
MKYALQKLPQIFFISIAMNHLINLGNCPPAVFGAYWRPPGLRETPHTPQASMENRAPSIVGEGTNYPSPVWRQSVAYPQHHPERSGVIPYSPAGFMDNNPQALMASRTPYNGMVPQAIPVPSSILPIYYPGATTSAVRAQAKPVLSSILPIYYQGATIPEVRAGYTPIHHTGPAWTAQRMPIKQTGPRYEVPLSAKAKPFVPAERHGNTLKQPMGSTVHNLEATRKEETSNTQSQRKGKSPTRPELPEGRPDVISPQATEINETIDKDQVQDSSQSMSSKSSTKKTAQFPAAVIQ